MPISSQHDSESQEGYSPLEVNELSSDIIEEIDLTDDVEIDDACLELPEPDPDDPPKRRLYFVNEHVEWQLTQYLWSGCTRVPQRDLIMTNATELIRQIIRKQGLHTIYPGQEDSAFGDLLQTAWVQIERTLYKYRAKPHCRRCFNPDRPNDSALYQPGDVEYGIKSVDDLIDLGISACPRCLTHLTPNPLIEAQQGTYGGTETVLYRGVSKVFNMWSQVARTVILAYIKKEGRDRKNSPTYTTYLDNRNKPVSDTMLRFLAEAREICQYNEAHLKVLEALEWLMHNDDKPYDGIIGKLVSKSGMPRATVTSMMKLFRMRSFEFTDSPINRELDAGRSERRRVNRMEFENEE